jgi:chromate transporter
MAYRDLCSVFLRAGLAFGGGLGILAVLQDQLVHKRRVVSRAEFLALYSLGMIVPSGTLTALAVAFGYWSHGFAGTIAALASLMLPSFIATVGLTVAYEMVRTSPLIDLVPITILPGALALIAVAAINLGKPIARPSVDLLLAIGALVGWLVLELNPAILLVLGGLVGVLAFRNQEA